MIIDYIKEQIFGNFGHNPTSQQSKVVDLLASFVCSDKPKEVFILRGYAGTGKTSLVSALVKTMNQLERRCVLMAPTGRAAKVLAKYAEFPAYTIHKRIYMYDLKSQLLASSSSYSPTYGRNVALNKDKNVVFVVDEASMLDMDTGILDDLITYVYSGAGCRLILMGDDAQLPPVGSTESPALNADIMAGYGLDVTDYTMTEVVRQKGESGILANATYLREMLTESPYDLHMPSIHFCKDTRNMPGDELVDAISDSYDRFGIEETAIVCRSNKRANIYNRGIRAQILEYEDELESGDIIMIAKNNYFWAERLEKEDQKTPFLANGDIAFVNRVRRERKLYGFRFADCELTFPDYDDMELTATVLLDTLHADAPSLTAEQGEMLFNKVMEDYADIRNKQERMKKLREDPYFNALQVKYAYAVTCHKAQGGQWKNVFIDQGYVTEDMIGEEYYRWLYTAFTRATRKVYLVNYKNS